MKTTFDNLKEWLHHRMDHFYYEDVSGHVQFDPQALMQEIDVFADNFERQIQ